MLIVFYDFVITFCSFHLRIILSTPVSRLFSIRSMYVFFGFFYKTGSLMRTPTDCADILAEGVSESGVYTIKPLDSGEPFMVYCDMETDGGGWTVRYLHFFKFFFYFII